MLASTMDLQPLGPARAPVSADELTRGLGLGELAPDDRPYVVLNMISTADGRATIDGRAGPIGNEADRELFHHLRTAVDAVMVGARTVKLEGYRRLVRDPELRAKRLEEGLAADPLAVIVSGRLDLPGDVPLLQDEEARVVVVTGSDAAVDGTRAQVTYLRSGVAGDVTLPEALRRLRVEHGVRSVLCEGGPALNASLLRDGLVDELFLSVAAKLDGSPDVLPIVRGLPLGGPVELELVWALQAESDLFLRYRIGERTPVS
jgi:riboflavin-specific deaminase-like protein